jgi:antibiotic biosynthesis monooxygenase (ABM) superfamily enzyme
MTARQRQRRMTKLQVQFAEVKQDFMQTENSAERRVLIKESQEILDEYNKLINEQMKLIYATMRDHP